jgi:glutamate racemase
MQDLLVGIGVLGTPGTVRSAIVQNKIMCGSGMTEAARLALAIARFDCTQ